MAIDPLTASLLTSGNNSGLAALGAVDPSLAAAQPELQLAQQMEQQGVSTAPAYPGAAIARALTGAIGAGLQKSAISDLAKAYSGSLPALQSIFPPNTPIGKAIASGNPIAIQMALKQAPQAMLLQSELQKTTPGENVSAGDKTIYSNQNPRSPVAVATQDAQRAQAQGNPAAANAIAAGVNKETSSPEGVPFTPAPLGRVPQTGGNPSPSAAIPPPTPGAPTQPSPTQYLQAREKLAQGLNNANAAGITNPTPTGISDGLPGQIAAAKGLQKDAEDTGAANAKYYDSLRRGLSGSAMIAAQQKQNIDVLRQIAASPNFTPGAGSDAALWLQRVAAQAGIKTAGAAPRELFNQVSARVLADQMSGIKSMASETGEAGGRIFKPMLDLEEKANITPEDSLAGVNAKLNLLDNAGNLMMKWGNNANEYLKSHPRLDPEFENGLRADIAAARIPKAVPGATSAAPAVAASPHSPAEIQAEMRRRGLIQ